ncbi:EAL domain-containing protein [Halanaerocella petrolearia]
MGPNLVEQLINVIEDREIRTVFQPIVNLKNGSILGYEALSRGPKDSSLESPYHLFRVAKNYDQLFALEKACRETALDNCRKIDDKYNIFINVDPAVIYDEDFRSGTTKEMINELSISQKEIVIELTEKTSIDDLQGFRLALDNYRQQGYKIAIDDTGAGYSGLQSIVSISYNYIKLDRSLVQDIDQDPVKKSLLEAFMEFADKINSKVIAEGIERKEELKTLIKMGVNYGQGYLIARPQEEIQTKLEITNQIIDMNKQCRYLGEETIVGELAKKNTTVTITSTTKNKVVDNLFEHRSELNSIVVLNDTQPVGIIMRDDFYYRLGTQYGYAIFINKAVQSIMDDQPLVVEANTSLAQVVELAMDRDTDNLYNSVIVTKNNQYIGVVSIKKILEELTNIQVEQAKHLNPLTNLPGNRIIKQEISSRIETKDKFAVLYADLDNFKVYNDYYGYQKGDQVIKFTSQVLSNVVSEIGSNQDFIGHIGGDDFVVVTVPDKVVEISQKTIDKFETGINQFFDSKDRERGCFIGENRQGEEIEMPLTSLSIAIVSNKDRKISSPLQVSDILAEVKKYVKAKSGSNYMLDRRRK